jgi:hypothetical protein
VAAVVDDEAGAGGLAARTADLDRHHRGQHRRGDVGDPRRGQGGGRSGHPRQRGHPAGARELGADGPAHPAGEHHRDDGRGDDAGASRQVGRWRGRWSGRRTGGAWRHRHSDWRRPVLTVASGRMQGWAFAAVRDEGPGIALEQQLLVFDRFWRGPDGRTGNEDRRTGLGLAIVRQIVESHGGTVAVHSAPGAGSTFVLWLPTISGHGPSRTDTPPSTDPLAVVRAQSS